MVTRCSERPTRTFPVGFADVAGAQSAVTELAEVVKAAA